MGTTASSVQVEAACAANVWEQTAAQQRPIRAKIINSRGLKRCLIPAKMRLVPAFGILTYTKRCANAPRCYAGTSCLRSREASANGGLPPRKQLRGPVRRATGRD